MKDKNREKKTAVPDIPNSITEESNDMGIIKIHENVIASIVRKATLGVEGVVRLAGSTFVDNLAEIVGSRRIHDRAISITIDKDSVKIEVKINVAYGVHVPTLAAEVQAVIMEEVEKITGMHVTQVNIIVQELDDVEAAAEEDNEKES